MNKPIFDQAHPKNHWNNFLLSCICITIQKISSFHQFILQIQPILESHDQTGHTHFWPYPSKNLWSGFNLCEFVSTCKKSGYFIDLFWRYDWLKNPAIWLAENILPISQKLEFSQIWDLFRNTTNNINIHYSTNSVKINDKIFQYIQKTLFLAHFPNFWGKKFFFWKIQLSCTTSYGFLASRKLMIQFQENTQTDGRTDRTTDRTDRPYFIGPFWLPPGGSKKRVRAT